MDRGSVYIHVEWPESQLFMEHPEFDSECILNFEESSAYFIPVDIYEEVTGEKVAL